MEGLEAAMFIHKGGKILQFHSEAQIRLVRAEAVQGFVIGNAHELRRQLDAQRFLEDMPHEPFDEREHILAGHKAHFDIDLGEFRLPVAARVLVAITARKLEVFVKSRYHKDLLVKLWRLGKRVEFSGVEP